MPQFKNSAGDVITVPPQLTQLYNRKAGWELVQEPTSSAPKPARRRRTVRRNTKETK